MSSDSAPGRDVSFTPAERDELLQDREWLQRRYERHGDNTIANELGVSAATVRRARARHQIPSRPRGGQSGVRGRAYTVRIRPHRPAAMRIAARISQETGVAAPTLGLVAERVRALHEAHAAGDKAAKKDALVGLGAACGLVLDHLDRLESLDG